MHNIFITRKIRRHYDNVNFCRSWNDEDVKLIIGIASKGDEHLEILSKLATEFETQEKVDEFISLDDKYKMKNALESVEN